LSAEDGLDLGFGLSTGQAIAAAIAPALPRRPQDAALRFPGI
jgi:hypothetical protein